MKNIFKIFLILFSLSTFGQVPAGGGSGVSGKVRYGTTIPTAIVSDNKNDTYIITDTGINSGILQSVWVYDGSIWKKTVTVTDPVIDFFVNADPNSALTTFSPNLANMIDVLYRSSLDGSLWSSNGTTYTPSVAATNRTLQQLNATGSVNSWNSIVEIGAIPLTANVIITLPKNTGSKNKDIIFKRIDFTSFTVSIVAFTGETTEITTPLNLNSQFGAITVQSVSTLKSEQINNIGVATVLPIVAEFGENVGITNNYSINPTASDIGGGSFTLPTAGTWEVEYNVTFSNQSINQTAQVWLSDNLNVAVPNSFGYAFAGDGSPVGFRNVTMVVRITTTGSTIYKLRGATNSGTGTISNYNGLGNAGTSRISWKKISGYSAVSGATVDYISANRIIPQITGIAVGSPILFNNKLEGNLSQTNGIFSLLAGKTYQLIGSSGITSGDRGLSVRWRNLTSGLLLGTEGGVITPTAGNGNAPMLGSANAILTTTVATTVQLEIVNFLGASAPSVIGYQVDQPNSSPYASIVQIGNTATLDNQMLNVSDLPTGGALQASTVDPYILGFNVTQNTANQVVAIPSPTSTTVNRIVYVNNTGTSNFKIGSITVGVSKTVAYIWNGSAWSNFSTEVVGAVSSEYGENNSILHNQNITSPTFVDITNSTFILPTAGIWEVTYNIHSYGSSVGNRCRYQLVKVSDLSVVANSSAVFVYPVVNHTEEVTQTVRITTTGADTYKIQGLTDGATLIIQNINGGQGGNSKIIWKKISGYLPVSGSTVDYASSIASATVPTGVTDVAWTGVTGPIANDGTLFTLLAGNTYRLQATVGLNFNTGSSANMSYQFVDASNNTIGANIGSVYNQVAGGTGDSPTPITAVTYTPSVTTQVKVRILSSGAVGGAFINRANLSIIQIGSTASIVNQAVNVADLPTGGALQSLPIDPYVLGFNVAQTTLGQYLTLPNPSSTGINRIIYVNNTGTANFNIGSDIIQANKTIGYIWNGTIWSAFGQQSVGAVIGEYGENNTITNGQTTSSSTLSAITNATITIPSAGVWNIGYNMYAWQSSGGQTISFVIKDALGNIVANSAGSGAGSSGNANAAQLVSQRVTVTTSAPTIYTIYWGTAGTGTATLVNTNPTTTAGSSVSKTFYQKLSGYFPVLGQSVDYVDVKGTTAQILGIGIGNALLFNTSTVSGNIPNSLGVFTLIAGKTYRLTGRIGDFNNAGVSIMDGRYQWRDITNNVLIGTSGYFVAPANGSYNAIVSGDAIATYTAVTNVTVKLEQTFYSFLPTIIGVTNFSYANITQLGSSAYNALNVYTGASSTTAGVTGGVPAGAIGDQGKMLMGDGTWMTSTTAINNITPATASGFSNHTNFGQTWNWSTATTQNALSFVAPSLTTGALLSLSASSNSAALNVVSGRVGIGQATPATKLDVFGSSLFGVQSAVEGLLSLGTNLVHIVSPTKLTTNAVAVPETALRLYRAGTNSVKYNPSVDLQIGSHTAGINPATILNFRLGGGASHVPDVDVMTIQSDVKVGIGTTTPEATLQIDNGLSGGLPTFAISGTNSTTYSGLTSTQLDAGGLFIQQNTSATNARTNIIAGGKTTGAVPSSIAFITTTVGGTQPTNKMLIHSNGNIGYGTNSPTSTVVINGSLGLRSVVITTNYTVLDTDMVIVCNSVTGITVTFPNATTYDGRIIYVTRDESSAGTLTINSASMIQNNAGVFALSITQATIGTWGANCQYIANGGRWKRLN